MSWRMPSPQRVAWRVVQTWFTAVVGIVAGLMTTTKIRKVLRGQHADGFPVTQPTSVPTPRGDATTYTYGADLFDAGLVVHVVLLPRGPQGTRRVVTTPVSVPPRIGSGTARDPQQG